MEAMRFLGVRSIGRDTMATELTSSVRPAPTRAWKRWLAGIFGLLFVACTAFQMSRHAFEEPPYETIRRGEGFEVRKYQPELVAETMVDATNHRDATRAGFRRLADYIFGNNTAIGGEGPQKVAMTTPVEATPRLDRRNIEARPNEEGRWIVTFILPSELTESTAPRPEDERVLIRRRPPRTVAVKRFSGRMDHATYQSKRRELLDALAKAGLSPYGPVTGAQYDPPGVLPSFRRNEVMVPIAP